MTRIDFSGSRTVSAPIAIRSLLYSPRAVVVVEAQPSELLHGDTTMIVLSILASIAAIGFLCWLLFTLAVFALPLFVGVSLGNWAFNTGAGWLGAAVVGLVAAAATLGLGQLLIGTVRPLWARLAIAIAFVAPAAVAGYYATLGIVKHTMPSEGWQIAFSIIGAIAVGITAFVRVTGMAAAPPARALRELEIVRRTAGGTIVRKLSRCGHRVVR